MIAHVADTAHYAWPYDGTLAASALALVLVGWDEGWAGRATADPATLERLSQLVVAVERWGGAIVAIAHGEPPAPVDAGDVVHVRAAGIDGFYGSALDAELRSDGRTHLLVAGHGIEGPVHSTLRSANDRGYECLLVTDACTSLTTDLAPASAHTVTMSGGIFGAIGTTAAVLDALHQPFDPTPAGAPR
jgi:nicotinamidase-related amidase